LAGDSAVCFSRIVPVQRCSRFGVVPVKVEQKC
jgi:hypothetical protein